MITSIIIHVRSVLTSSYQDYPVVMRTSLLSARCSITVYTLIVRNLQERCSVYCEIPGSAIPWIGAQILNKVSNENESYKCLRHWF